MQLYLKNWTYAASRRTTVLCTKCRTFNPQAKMDKTRLRAKVHAIFIAAIFTILIGDMCNAKWSEPKRYIVVNLTPKQGPPSSGVEDMAHETEKIRLNYSTSTTLSITWSLPNYDFISGYEVTATPVVSRKKSVRFARKANMNTKKLFTRDTFVTITKLRSAKQYNVTVMPVIKGEVNAERKSFEPMSAIFKTELESPTSLQILQYPRNHSVFVRWKRTRVEVESYYLVLRSKNNPPSRERTWHLAPTILEQVIDNLPSTGGKFTVTLEARKGRFKSKPLTKTFILESLEANNTKNRIPPAPYVPELLSEELDVIYLLDGSYSVGAQGFEEVKCFFKNLTEHLDVGYQKVRVGAMRYSYRTRTEFDLRTHRTRPEVTRALKIMPYRGGKTYTGRAISYVRRHSFSMVSGGRLNVAKVVIVVSDDPSQDSVDGPAQKLLQQDNTFVIVVGIGDASQSELRTIAGEGPSVFYVRDIQNLCSIWPRVHKRLKDKLAELHAVRPDPPSGLNIGVHSKKSISLTWRRPKGLATSYVVQYGNAGSPDERMKEIHLKTGLEVATLHDLDTRDFALRVIAVGRDQRSLPAQIEYDTACAGLPMDLIVVGEESWGRKGANFEYLKAFMLSLSNAFLIGPTTGRMGVILYTARSRRFVVPLSTYSDRRTLQTRIESMRVGGGRGTKTGLALEYTRETGFRYTRENAVKVVLLITSRNSDDEIDEAATALKESGVLVYAIGVSSRSEAEELRQIVSKPSASHVFNANKYHDLVALQPNIVRSICNGALESLGTITPRLEKPASVWVERVHPDRFTIAWSASIEQEYVTGYEVRVRGDGKLWKISLTGGTREAEVADLRPGTEYAIQVFATGYKQDSDSANITVVTTLPGPWNIVATNVSPTSADISWNMTSNQMFVFQLTILARSDDREIFNVSLTNASYHVAQLAPGTTYLAQVQAIYREGKESDPSTVQFITGLVAPERIYLTNVTSTTATMSWQGVGYEPRHDEEGTVRYLAEIVDTAGGLRGTKLVVNERSVKFRDLTPGTHYTIRLYVKSGSLRSNPVVTNLTTPAISLRLDLAIVVGVSPDLTNTELFELKNVLLTFVRAFRLGRDRIRLGIAQLADPFKILVSLTGVKSQNIFDNIYELERRLQPGIISEDSLLEIANTVFEDDRPTAAKAIIVLNTDRNVPFMKTSSLKVHGIDVISIQLGAPHHTTPSRESESSYNLDTISNLHHMMPFIIRDLENIDKEYLQSFATALPTSSPTNFRAVEIGDSTASLEWDNPENGLASPRFYRVQVLADGKPVNMATLRSSAKGIDLVRLNSGCTYRVVLSREQSDDQSGDVIEFEFRTKDIEMDTADPQVPETAVPTILPVPRSSAVTTTAQTRVSATAPTLDMTTESVEYEYIYSTVADYGEEMYDYTDETTTPETMPSTTTTTTARTTTDIERENAADPATRIVESSYVEDYITPEFDMPEDVPEIDPNDIPTQPILVTRPPTTTRRKPQDFDITTTITPTVSTSTSSDERIWAMLSLWSRRKQPKRTKRSTGEPYDNDNELNGYSEPADQTLNDGPNIAPGVTRGPLLSQNFPEKDTVADDNSIVDVAIGRRSLTNGDTINHNQPSNHHSRRTESRSHARKFVNGEINGLNGRGTTVRQRNFQWQWQTLSVEKDPLPFTIGPLKTDINHDILNGFGQISAEPVVATFQGSARSHIATSDGPRMLNAEVMSDNSLNVTWNRWKGGRNGFDTTTTEPASTEYIVAYSMLWPLSRYEGEVRAEEGESSVVITDLPQDARFKIDLYEGTGHRLGVVDTLQIDIPPSTLQAATEVTETDLAPVKESGFKINAPFNFHVVKATPNSIRLEWSAGESSGEVITYEVQYYDLATPVRQRQVATVATFINLSPLSPGHTYKAALVAKRNGSRSAPVSPEDVLYTPIPPPKNLTVSFRDDGTLVAKWTALEEVDILRYKVYYSKSKTNTPRDSLEVEDSTIEIAGFQPMQFFSISVKSVLGDLESDAVSLSGYANYRSAGGREVEINQGLEPDDSEGAPTTTASPSTTAGEYSFTTSAVKNISDTVLRAKNVTDHSVTLYWDKYDDPQGGRTRYLIQRALVMSTGVVGRGKTHRVDAGAYEFIPQHLEPATTYQARLLVESLPGNEGRVLLDTLTFKTTFPSPSLKSVTSIGPYTAHLEWDKAMFPYKYRIHVIEDESDSDGRIRIKKNVRRANLVGGYTLMDLVPGTRFRVEVSTVWGRQVSKPSIVRFLTEPLPPRKFQIQHERGNRYSLSWMHPRGARSRYVVRFSRSGDRALKKEFNLNKDIDLLGVDVLPKTSIVFILTTIRENKRSDSVKVTIERPSDSEEVNLNEAEEGGEDGSTVAPPAGPPPRQPERYQMPADTSLPKPKLKAVRLIETDLVRLDWKKQPTSHKYRIIVTENEEDSDLVSVVKDFTVSNSNVVRNATIEDLTPGTRYRAKIRAVEDDGASMPTIVLFTTKPTQPTNFRFRHLTGSTYQVNWQHGRGRRDQYSVSFSVAANRERGESFDIDGDLNFLEMQLPERSKGIFTFITLRDDKRSKAFKVTYRRPPGVDVEFDEDDNEDLEKEKDRDIATTESIIITTEKVLPVVVSTSESPRSSFLPTPVLKPVRLTRTHSARLEWTKQEISYPYRITVAEDEAESKAGSVLKNFVVSRTNDVRQATIEGLQPGTRYDVEVWAEEDDRISLPASTSFVTRPTPPHNFRIVQWGGVIYQLTWQHGEGRRDEYIVRYLPSTIQESTIDGSLNSLEIPLPDRSKGTLSFVALRGGKRSKSVEVFYRKQPGMDVELQEVEEDDEEPTTSTTTTTTTATTTTAAAATTTTTTTAAAESPDLEVGTTETTSAVQPTATTTTATATTTIAAATTTEILDLEVGTTSTNSAVEPTTTTTTTTTASAAAAASTTTESPDLEVGTTKTTSAAEPASTATTTTNAAATSTTTTTTESPELEVGTTETTSAVEPTTTTTTTTTASAATTTTTTTTESPDLEVGTAETTSAVEPTTTTTTTTAAATTTITTTDSPVHSLFPTPVLKPIRLIETNLVRLEWKKQKVAYPYHITVIEDEAESKPRLLKRFNVTRTNDVRKVVIEGLVPGTRYRVQVWVEEGDRIGSRASTSFTARPTTPRNIRFIHLEGRRYLLTWQNGAGRRDSYSVKFSSTVGGEPRRVYDVDGTSESVEISLPRSGSSGFVYFVARRGIQRSKTRKISYRITGEDVEIVGEQDAAAAEEGEQESTDNERDSKSTDEDRNQQPTDQDATDKDSDEGRDDGTSIEGTIDGDRRPEKANHDNQPVDDSGNRPIDSVPAPSVTTRLPEPDDRNEEPTDKGSDKKRPAGREPTPFNLPPTSSPDRRTTHGSGDRQTPESERGGQSTDEESADKGADKQPPDKNDGRKESEDEPVNPSTATSPPESARPPDLPAPVLKRVRLTDTHSARLEWKKKKVPHPYRITLYEDEATSDKRRILKTFTVARTNDVREASIEDLVPGTRYRAEVHAEEGDSISLPASTSFITRPTPPYNFKIKHQEGDLFQLTWQPGDGRRDRYTVQFSRTIDGTPGKPFNISGDLDMFEMALRQDSKSLFTFISWRENKRSRARKVSFRRSLMDDKDVAEIEEEGDGADDEEEPSETDTDRTSDTDDETSVINHVTTTKDPGLFASSDSAPIGRDRNSGVTTEKPPGRTPGVNPTAPGEVKHLDNRPDEREGTIEDRNDEDPIDEVLHPPKSDDKSGGSIARELPPRREESPGGDQRTSSPKIANTTLDSDEKPPDGAPGFQPSDRGNSSDGRPGNKAGTPEDRNPVNPTDEVLHPREIGDANESTPPPRLGESTTTSPRTRKGATPSKPSNARSDKDPQSGGVPGTSDTDRQDVTDRKEGTPEDRIPGDRIDDVINSKESGGKSTTSEQNTPPPGQSSGGRTKPPKISSDQSGQPSRLDTIPSDGVPGSNPSDGDHESNQDSSLDKKEGSPEDRNAGDPIDEVLNPNELDGKSATPNRNRPPSGREKSTDNGARNPKRGRPKNTGASGESTSPPDHEESSAEGSRTQRGKLPKPSNATSDISRQPSGGVPGTKSSEGEDESIDGKEGTPEDRNNGDPTDRVLYPEEPDGKSRKSDLNSSASRRGKSSYAEDLRLPRREPSCSSGKTDLIFILDISSTISTEDQQTLREWLAKVVAEFDVSPNTGDANKTWVSVVQYADRAMATIPLGDYATREDLIQAILTLGVTDGDAYTGSAIDFAQTSIFETQGRPEARRIAVVITDEESEDDVASPSTIMRESGSKIFFVGIGDVSEDELMDIASEPTNKFSFIVENYNGLSKLQKKLRWAICRETEGKKNAPRRAKTGKCLCKNGRDGAPGKPGPQGERGFSGAKGERGPEGRTGPTGKPGRPGSQGPVGKPGKPGVSESKSMGDIDFANVLSDENVVARMLQTLQEGVAESMEKGDPGPTGPRGSPGPPGNRGLTGPRGPAGPAGDQGEHGDPGRNGLDGSAGPPGRPGEKGDRADSLDEEYLTSIVRRIVGEMLNRHEDQYHSGGASSSSSAPSRIVIRRGFPGTPGVRGLSGPPGRQGYEGPRGKQGHRGPGGLKGSRGMKGDIGDKGERGVPGIGIEGPQGNPGRPGPVGRSIQGPAGQRGEKGILGEQGRGGHKGQKGERGVCSANTCQDAMARLQLNARQKRSTEDSVSTKWWPWE